MNKYEKEVHQALLSDEKAIINELKGIYKQAIDSIDDRLAALLGRTDTENLQSIIYQQQYQRALKTQINAILDEMNASQFTSISEYLTKSYEGGYLGAMYSIHKQGIPIIAPINQKAVVKALQIDSKLSQKLYTRLGEDVDLLKKKVRTQLSKGIANNYSYHKIAKELASETNIGLNKSIRIARTEGHRIQAQSSMDAGEIAKKKGANIVKQWDASLDGNTRPLHRKLDGQIREVEDFFEVNGFKAKQPGGFGVPHMDINCRCSVNMRAKWGLDEDELEELKKRAEYFGLDKSEDFEDFKKKYLKVTDKDLTNNGNSTYNGSRESISVECQQISNDLKTFKGHGVEYRKVEMHSTPLKDDEIISVLSGGDTTSGSCASLGLAYCGQKGGMDVLDFRGGESLDFFSNKKNLRSISQLPGVTTFMETARSSVTAGNKLLKKVEIGKEYYLVCGRHAAIVRKTSEGVLQYLELQSATRSGWTNFDGNPRYTLSWRFGENKGYDVTDFMIDVDSLKNSSDLKHLLGYINTKENEQRKGKYGTIK